MLNTRRKAAEAFANRQLGFADLALGDSGNIDEERSVLEQLEAAYRDWCSRGKTRAL